MNKNDHDGIWVFAEQRNAELHEVTLELLGKARGLAGQNQGKVTAIILGQGIKPLAQTLLNYGADSVLVADNPVLDPYRLIPYSLVFEKLIKEYHPEILLMGATFMGVELAPRVAARVRTGLSAHCVDLKLDKDGKLLQVVPGWGGGVIATIACPDHRPQMATVMPGTMKPLSPEERKGEIKEIEINLPDKDLGPKVLEIKREKAEGLPLEKAEVVVAGGWGVGSREDWKQVEELAGVLGGAVGTTRPPVDEGWAEEGQMIGQSGKTVRPKLYMGIGISGVMHHVVGMDQSEHIITINSDANAEIFETSDVIVVEDFRKILPKLIQKIRERVER
ncbi:MAG: electron transfer flavoprotein subunit alpha/FixB family protein [Desulfobacteraceae bacterium]|nr:electron transfer flavoprotein subunit alpha/FixB family protein [Desulfobacteraceae bacterium]